jgi:hypothetical protein
VLIISIFSVHKVFSLYYKICCSLLSYEVSLSVCPGNTKGGGITVLLTSCLTGLD